MTILCKCNCGYRCGGPGSCKLSALECLRQTDDKHFVRDCGHKFDGPWKELENGGSVTCSICGITAA